MLVDDSLIWAAVKLMMEHTHNLIEGAGAAPLAAALALRERLAGRQVVLIASGGNLSAENLQRALAA